VAINNSIIQKLLATLTIPTCTPPLERERVKIIIANGAYVYGWTLGESEIAEMGHSYSVGNSS